MGEGHRLHIRAVPQTNAAVTGNGPGGERVAVAVELGRAGERVHRANRPRPARNRHRRFNRSSRSALERVRPQPLCCDRRPAKRVEAKSNLKSRIAPDEDVFTPHEGNGQQHD